MNITSSYQVRIVNCSVNLNDTVRVYREALSYLIGIVNENWDAVKSITTGALEQRRYIEKLVHGNKNREAKYPEFDKKFRKYPSYLRRATITAAIGAVSSSRSNLANWENTDKQTAAPTLQIDRKAFPTFFRDDMFEVEGAPEKVKVPKNPKAKDKLTPEEKKIEKEKHQAAQLKNSQNEITALNDKHTVHLKVYHKSDWVWATVTLRKTDIAYLRKYWMHACASAPVLEKRFGKYSLRFSFEENISLSKTPIKKQRICAVDLGLNTDATCCIMTADGTILARKFINFASDKDHLYHVLNRIKKFQRLHGSREAHNFWAYADTVETNWEELFDGFDRLYAITFSSGIEFVNKVINKFSYAEVVFGCEKIIANDIAAIMSVQIDSVQRLAKSKSAGNLANRLDDGSLQLYVSRDTKSHEKIFILESADHKRVRVITGSANMSASAFCGIQRENIVCFDDEAAFSHYKVLFETFKETCSDNVSYKTVVSTMNQEDYLKENIKEVPVFQSIEKQKLIFLEQAQPEDEVEYEIVADVKKMQELVKPIMPKMAVQANRIVVAAEPMRVFTKRYTEVRRVAAEAVKQLPKLHIDYDAGTMTFNDENIDLNPNLSEVAKNIKSIQKFFSGMDYFYGDVEQAKKDYFKYMTWYLATPFMAYLRYFASRNNYDTKLFPMYGVIYGDSNGGKTTFIKFLVKLMCGETVKMNTTEDFTATRIDGLKRVCEGLPLNIDDLAKTQFQNHSERVIKNDEWGISDRLVNYPAVSITSNKITSLTKDLSKRAIICRIGAKIDNERGAKNSKRVNESMSELTTAFYGEYVRRMLVCIDEMTTEMRENANGKEYFPDIFHASSSVIADIFEACGVDLPDYVRILYYNDYMGDESIGRAAIEKIELAWQADPSKFRVDKKQNRLIYTYPQDGPWYELKYIADELPNSLEAEISGGNQLIMNYEQAQELFGIKFRRWLGIFNL